ncbi:MAG: class I SAM-dependent methyltransferase [Acidobacteria bacterium]|nr:class I SAM-dependent methyltransferase [Acidobacteriota bacterium]MBV9477925.1 class I SAM-dependent methyltransferase [Acidobacteriota bacterium]
MALAFLPDESHPMVDALLRTRVPRWRELNRAIDERDDMLDFALTLLDHDRDAALTNYFQNGLEQYELVKHIAAWRASRPARMLDFASGYGRLTRFLVHEHLADSVTVSDILEGGMEFQAGQFGVRTILSTQNPEEFAAPETYDVIFVASLFTHLPPATFTRWLRRLAQFLTKDGLLLFSVHDESIAPEGVADGIAFASYSESRVLDANDYGSTWVTESFVREQVRGIGAEWACVRLPRALSDWQDVYVVSPSAIEHPQPRRVPKGFIERAEVEKDGIHFDGWATAGDEAPERVDVCVDDEVVASVRTFHARADVAQWLGNETASHSGWSCVVPHTAVRSFRFQTATVSAYSRAGVERILFHGTLDAATAFVAKERARARDQQILACVAELAELRERLAVTAHERDTLAVRIDAMRQSRFWKARERWFALKRAARLTDEE